MKGKTAVAAALIAAVFAGCHQVKESRYKIRYDEQVKPAVAPADSEAREPSAAAASGAGQPGPAAGRAAPAEKPPVAAAPEPRQAGPEGRQGRASEARKKAKVRSLDIRSDTMNFNRETSLAVFERNVKVSAGDLTMYADLLTSADYRKSAEAEGNVRLDYREYGIKIKSKRFNYTNSMSLVKAYDDVSVMKVHEDGNTMTMNADEIVFDTDGDVITALKKKNRVKIRFKDMVAFCDKLVYNDVTREMELSGSPIIKKKKSLFLSEVVVMNVDTQRLDLKQGIWTKVFYRDFEEAKKEAESETAKNRPSR